MMNWQLFCLDVYKRQALQAIGFKTEVLRKKSLFSQIKQFEEIIMPDEDVSHRFVEDYLKEKNVKFVSRCV